MSKHTPEPWVIDEREDLSTNFYSDDAMGSIIGGCLAYNYAYRTPDERKANASRIVACVNACRGLPTDELERNGLVAAVGTDLLAALEGLLADMHLRARLDGDVDSDGCVVLNCGNGVLYAANKAIAKAKGIDHE